MKSPIPILVLMILLLLPEQSALACATCSLDQGGSGQTLMLVSMICLPFVVAAIGFAVLRRILSRLGAS